MAIEEWFFRARTTGQPSELDQLMRRIVNVSDIEWFVRIRVRGTPGQIEQCKFMMQKLEDVSDVECACVPLSGDGGGGVRGRQTRARASRRAP